MLNVLKLWRGRSWVLNEKNLSTGSGSTIFIVEKWISKYTLKNHYILLGRFIPYLIINFVLQLFIRYQNTDLIGLNQ